MNDQFREREAFASKRGTTRRAILKGMLTVGGAGVPVVVAADIAKFDFKKSTETVEPRQIARHHAEQLCKAMNAVSPDKKYTTCFHDEDAFVMIIGVPVRGDRDA